MGPLFSRAGVFFTFGVSLVKRMEGFGQVYVFFLSSQQGVVVHANEKMMNLFLCLFLPDA